MTAPTMARSLAVTRTEVPWRAVLEDGRGEQLVAESRYGARQAEIAPLPDDLHPALLEALFHTQAL